jgi:alpha-N-arabinofuranosidase
VHDPEGRRLTLFALNRSLTDELPLKVSAMGYDGLTLKQALQLHESDLKAINSKAEPDRVTPRPLGSVRVSGDRVEATLAPASWNVIELNVS